MRAFLVTWKSFISYLNNLIFMVGMSLLWFATGGIMVVIAGLVAWSLIITGGAWWLALLLAIPIGPATAALAVTARRCAADIRVTREHYFAGLRAFWRPALGLSAIGMGGLALMFLNLIFYFSQNSAFLQALGVIFAYLIIFWLGVQFYAYPVLVRMEKPKALPALRTAALGAWANPFFSLLLVVIAAVLTGLSVMTLILFFVSWPALMALLGEHSFKLFLERAGVKEEL